MNWHSLVFSLFLHLESNLYFTILIISPPFRSVLFCFPFCGLWRPFLHLCCCLFTPVYSHCLYFNVLRPHILLISIFLCLFGAPPFFHFFFSFLNFDAPICLSYFTILIISPPFRSVLFCFPFCALWRPFLHLRCCLFTPLYSHFCHFGASELSLTVSFF